MVKEAGQWVRANVRNANTESKEGGGDGVREVEDCQSFVMTAPGPETGEDRNSQRLSHSISFPSFLHLCPPISDSRLTRLVLIRSIAPWYTNPQTEAFCKMIGMTNKINPPPAEFQSGS